MHLVTTFQRKPRTLLISDVIILGKAICDIIAVHKQIESQTNNVVSKDI